MTLPTLGGGPQLGRSDLAPHAARGGDESRWLTVGVFLEDTAGQPREAGECKQSNHTGSPFTAKLEIGQGVPLSQGSQQKSGLEPAFLRLPRCQRAAGTFMVNAVRSDQIQQPLARTSPRISQDVPSRSRLMFAFVDADCVGIEGVIGFASAAALAKAEKVNEIKCIWRRERDSNPR
ncbi:hypothetical protein [Aquamicrobium terrae]|uniref:hypothetical protein n=1 Tax=Aquamicrobium terrae TaxID=1324945 RepID=UPI003399F89E